MFVFVCPALVVGVNLLIAEHVGSPLHESRSSPRVPCREIDVDTEGYCRPLLSPPPPVHGRDGTRRYNETCDTDHVFVFFSGERDRRERRRGPKLLGSVSQEQVRESRKRKRGQRRRDRQFRRGQHVFAATVAGTAVAFQFHRRRQLRRRFKKHATLPHLPYNYRSRLI